jgi:hypothetical protein
MKYLLSIAIFVTFFASCKAQQAGARFTNTSVVIYNNSNNKMAILLGESPAKMDTFKLNRSEVWFSPIYNHNPTIKIQTQNHVITYQLRLGNYYMIFWNDKKKYWDVEKTKKRQ